MVQLPSTMIPLGTTLPGFELTDVVNYLVISPEQYKDERGILLMFICGHCPYVKHVQYELAALGREFGKVIGMIAISSNDPARHSEDTPDGLKELAERLGFTFPLCFDESQEVAKKLHVACTPDFYLFNKERKLVYRGQLDGSRPGNTVPVTGKDLRAALQALLNDTEISKDQHPSMGCSIKWKPGNEPRI